MNEELLTTDINMTRNQMHTKLMICVYQYLFYLNLGEKPDINSIIEATFNISVSELDPFVKKCFLSVIRNMQTAVNTVSPLLKNWQFERLNLIEQAILILGFAEITYMDMPKPVVNDICVKLAIKYADEESHKFINAVLENI